MEMLSQQDRRDSVRVSCIQVCPYELTKFSSQDKVELSKGWVFTINMSVGGLLLLLPQPIDEKQILEIKAPSIADERRATRLVEVCWTRSLPVTARTTMHLAGARLLFEPPAN
jgi:c-di-GMP-binding flagellar brake protein YcgR